jgi:hypothetical protein
VCDCADFGLIRYLQATNYEHFTLDWGEEDSLDNEHETAINNVNNDLSMPNNLQRKRLCRRMFRSLDFGPLEPYERRRLPVCAEARVRQIYPSSDGLYVGFKEQ